MNLSGASLFQEEKEMLKLNASYSKKVPAEGEYSSQSYHASIEVELPDGLTQDQLNELTMTDARVAIQNLKQDETFERP